MSHSLNPELKAELLTKPQTKKRQELVERLTANHCFVDPTESSEFHEGVAAGIVLAFDIIEGAGGITPESTEFLKALTLANIKASQSDN